VLASVLPVRLVVVVIVVGARRRRRSSEMDVPASCVCVYRALGTAGRYSDDGAAPSDNLMWIGEAHPDQRSPQDHQAQRLDGGGESNGWYAKCKQADAARIEMQVIICGSRLCLGGWEWTAGGQSSKGRCKGEGSASVGKESSHDVRCQRLH